MIFIWHSSLLKKSWLPGREYKSYIFMLCLFIAILYFSTRSPSSLSLHLLYLAPAHFCPRNSHKTLSGKRIYDSWAMNPFWCVLLWGFLKDPELLAIQVYAWRSLAQSIREANRRISKSMRNQGPVFIKNLFWQSHWLLIGHLWVDENFFLKKNQGSKQIDNQNYIILINYD